MIEVENINQRKHVVVGNKEIKSWRYYCNSNEPQPIPETFCVEKTTVWSFPNRGYWATHTPQYRGNWSPYVVRNLLCLYSKEGDLVLDPMVGGGTTPVECYITGRNSISVDINPDAISIVKDRLDFSLPQKNNTSHTVHRTFIGDTRNLDLIDNESVDLILAHPPYANIIKYTKNNPNDLSLIDSFSTFFTEFNKAIIEYYRVLKPGKFCAVMIGDTHNKGHYVPISARILIDFLNNNFVLKEDIIKKEWNCESNIHNKTYASNFLLTMHEHIFVFKKPQINTDNYPNSSKKILYERS